MSARISLMLTGLAIILWSCGANNQANTLILKASVKKLAADGAAYTDITVVAMSGNTPGTGTVVLTAPHGSLGTEQITTVQLSLSQSGEAVVPYWCDATKDAECEGSQRLEGLWNGAHAYLRIAFTKSESESGSSESTDPCKTQNGGCDNNATCSVVNGIPTCSCKDGYQGNGKVCIDSQTCAAGGGSGVLKLVGDESDSIAPGTRVITSGKWGSIVESLGYIRVFTNPTDDQLGLWWDITFSTTKLQKSLASGFYDNAERAPFASDGHPGLEVSGDGRGCNRLSGNFTIHQIEVDESELKYISASFEQHCEERDPKLVGSLVYCN